MENQPLPYDQAQALQQSGYLSPELVTRMYPETPPPVAAPPVVTEAPAAAVEQPLEMAPPKALDFVDSAVSDAESEKKREQDLADAEKRDMSQKQGQLLKDIISQKIKMDVREGVSADKIREKYKDDLERLKAYDLPQDQATMQNASITNPSAQPVSLATDHPTLQVDPLARQKAMMDMLKPDQTGYGMQQQALQDAAEVGKAKAAEESAAITNAAKNNEQRIKAQEGQQAERSKMLDNEMGRLNQSVTDLQAMSVDPKRYWADKSTGDKVMAGIGLLLGAFGSGGNKAVAVIDKAIDQDIAAQKADIAKASDVVSARRGIYQDMRSRFKDDQMATEATRIAYLDNALLKTKAIGAKYTAPELKAKTDLLVGELEQKKAEATASFQQQMLKTLPGLLDPNNPNAMNEDQRKRFVPGMGVALTEDDAKQLKTYNADATLAKDSINRLKQIGQIPGRSLSPELRAEADTVSKMLQGALRTTVLGPGTVQQAERDMLETIISNPTSMFGLSSTQMKRLDSLLQQIDLGVASKAKSYGLTTTADRIGFTPKGR